MADLLMENGANYDENFLIREYLERFCEENTLQALLNSSDMDDLLIKNLTLIFNKLKKLKQYILDKRPIGEFPNFYPISFARRPGNILQITLHRRNLKHSYLKIFKKLSKHLATYPKSAIRITYRGEQGIDGGGLRREFLNAIFQNLSHDYDYRHHCLTGNHEWLIHVGRVMRWLNDFGGTYPIGYTFHESIYKAILSFEHSDLIKPFESISPENALKIYELTGFELPKGIKEFIMWDGSLKNRKNHLSFLKDLIQVLELDDLPDFKQVKEWQKRVYEEVYRIPVKNLYYLAKGMTYKENEWKFLQNIQWEQLQKVIEGDFNKKLLIKNMVFPDNDAAEYKKAFKSWVENKSVESLKQFLKHLTGMPSLPLKKGEITVKFYDEDQVVVRTCPRRVFIPRKNLSIEKFLMLLELFSEKSTQEYNIG